VSVWTGISGHGKSTILSHYLISVARRNDCPFALFTPENMPVYKFMVKLAEILLHKRKDKFADGELELVRDFLAQNAIVVYPEEMTIDHILALMRTAVLQHGVKMCVIDPWNMIESSRPKDMTETEYVSMVMSKLSIFSKKNQVAMHLVAHPAKYANYANKEKEPKPGLNEISTSGNFRTKCDFGLVVHRDIYDDDVPTEVTVLKVRDDDYGTTGACWFDINIETRTITPVDKPRTNLTVLARHGS
jgi:twinkle protein